MNKKLTLYQQIRLSLLWAQFDVIAFPLQYVEGRIPKVPITVTYDFYALLPHIQCLAGVYRIGISFRQSFFQTRVLAPRHTYKILIPQEIKNP